MKNFLALGLLALALCGCSKEEVETSPEEVELKLNYTFTESGSMTRAGSDVYNAFYEKHIKTKELTPKTYSLRFINKTTGNLALEVDGSWGDNNVVKLPSGTYTVAGTSYPIIEGYEGVPADSVYMRFGEEITIKEDMNELLLNAKYDCYLLLFDKSNATSINYNSAYNYTTGSKVKSLSLSFDENNYWLFVHRENYYFTDVENNITNSYSNRSIDINRKNNDITTIYFAGLDFELGKYYYFNDTTSSFDIPPMESGN